MSILVTGTPGSGKTSLVKYARDHHDDRFIDTDEIPGLCEWREFSTGRVLGLVSDFKQPTDDAWYQQYGWYWRADVLTDFLQSSPDVILCGSSENIVEYYKLFNLVVILNKTKDELYNNLQSPERQNPFGKTPKQREGFMKWQAYLAQEAIPYNTTLLHGNDIPESYRSIITIIK